MFRKSKKAVFKKILSLHEEFSDRYTAKKEFTTGQVDTVFSYAKISPKYLQYAYALYLSKKCFDSVYKGKEFDYDALREEVSIIAYSGQSALVGTEGVTADFGVQKKSSHLWHPSGFWIGI